MYYPLKGKHDTKTVTYIFVINTKKSNPGWLFQYYLVTIKKQILYFHFSAAKNVAAPHADTIYIHTGS